MKKKAGGDLVKLYERFRDLVVADAKKNGKTQRADYLARWGRLSTWDRIPIKGSGRVNFLEALRLKGFDVDGLIEGKAVEIRYINRRPLIYVAGMKFPEPEKGSGKNRSRETGYDF